MSKLIKSKKLIAIISCFCLVFAFCCVNASGSTTTGAEDVASALESGLSSSNIWGTLLALTGFIIIITLVAVGRRVANKNLNSAKNGKAGKF